MDRYRLLVIAVSMGVDLLLIWGVAELVGVPLRWFRVGLSVILGGMYTLVCVYSESGIQGSYFWRFLLWASEGWICFGGNSGGFRRGVFFAVLAAAVSEGAAGVGGLSVRGMGSGALLVCALCLLDMRRHRLKKPYVPVLLIWENQKERILALRDTGNTLRDPVTGEPVLVAGPSVAQRMLGLTEEELSTPAKTLVDGKIKGLRLIPYRSVGQSNGMLLAVRVPRAKVGTRQGSVVVAFTPTVLDPENRYHALAGGCV